MEVSFYFCPFCISNADLSFLYLFLYFEFWSDFFIGCRHVLWTSTQKIGFFDTLRLDFYFFQSGSMLVLHHLILPLKHPPQIVCFFLHACANSCDWALMKLLPNLIISSSVGLNFDYDFSCFQLVACCIILYLQTEESWKCVIWLHLRNLFWTKHILSYSILSGARYKSWNH